MDALNNELDLGSFLAETPVGTAVSPRVTRKLSKGELALSGQHFI
jgi:hypothetical protein